MNLYLIAAIAFTVAALLSIARPARRYPWLLPLVLSAAAIINWLRYFEIML